MKEYYLTIRVNQEELETAKATFSAGGYKTEKVERLARPDLKTEKDKVFLIVRKK